MNYVTNESKKIYIEKAKPEDVRGIQEVFYRAWLVTYPNEAAKVTVEYIEELFKDRFLEENLAKREKYCTNPPEGETWLVAKEDEKVVGLVTPIRKADRNQLQRIYVHPDYLHKGIGTKLWEAAKEYMDMNKDTYVELVEYNERAKSFYEKLGFKDTSRRWQGDLIKLKTGVNPTQMEMVLRGKA